MTYWEAFIESELCNFIFEYAFLYGTEYVDKNRDKIVKKFEEKFRKMTEEEKEKKFEKFVKYVKYVKEHS